MKISIPSPLNDRCTRLTRPLFAACCWVSFLLHGAHLAAKDDFSEEIQKSEEVSIEKYPELGVANSAFNKNFLAAVKLLKEKRPEFFSDPQWPLKLSDAVAADLKVSPKHSLDSPPIQQSQEDVHASETLERYCAQAVKRAVQKHEVNGSNKDWFETDEHLDSERIADSLKIAALQSEEVFDEVVETFLWKVLSSTAPRALPKNRDWIKGVLWTRSSWRCIETYSEPEQCHIIGRLLAKCGDSKLVTDWLRPVASGTILQEKSLLNNPQSTLFRQPGYPLRSGISDLILNGNYRLGSTPIDKADFFNSALHSKMWKIYQHTSPSEWGLIGGWNTMDQLPSVPPSYDQPEWRQTLEHLESAVQSRASMLRKLPNLNHQPPSDIFGCFEAYLVCGFCEFKDIQQGLEWIDSVCKQTALSPDPAIRGASKLARAFKLSALSWAGKQK
jgi:hypothetical protein